MSLTESWDQSGVYSALNEACPPGYRYMENACSTGRGGGLANQSLSSVLDLHAPIKTWDVAFARSAPWYTPELRNMKSTGRILEQHLRNSGLIVHKLALQEHQRAYSKALKEARSTFYSNLINKKSGNSKLSFETPVTVPQRDNGIVV